MSTTKYRSPEKIMQLLQLGKQAAKSTVSCGTFFVLQKEDVMIRTLKCDILVVGGGGAGTRAAIEAARNHPDMNILIMNQGPIGKSGLTSMANGGIHWVSHPDDSFEAHFEDVVRMGYFLNDQNLVDVLVHEAPERAEELIRWGAKILMDGDKYLLTDPKGSGCSFPRGHYIPGVTFISTLRQELERFSNVRIFEDFFATALTVVNKKVVGATAIDIRKGECFAILSKATILASGGLGEIYLHTTNSPFGLRGYASGTGYALAYQAGAELIDMEMVQFTGHQLYPPWPLGNPALLSSLCGGKYVNSLGEEFLSLPQPRDMIQKLAYKEVREGRGSPSGGVFIDLSLSPLTGEEIEKQLKISLGGEVAKERWKLIKKMSINDPDPKRWKVEFTPGGAHFCMGGVRINERCETTVEGLFAAGEVTGGVHGANRMGGNALSEILVFGARAGRFAAEYAKDNSFIEPDRKFLENEYQRIHRFFRDEGVYPRVLKERLGAVMSSYMSVIRNGKEMEKALYEIEDLRDEARNIRVPMIKRFNRLWIEAIEVLYMIDVAEMMVRSALFRKESRGGHYREDYPELDKEWLKHTCVYMEDGKMNLSTRPVIFTKLKPES